jgi:hypothetical protein
LGILSIWALGLTLAAGPAAAQDATTVTVYANLIGSEESPAAISTSSFGKGIFVINRTLQTIDYTIFVFNFPSGLVGAHIHASPRNVNGPIIFAVPLPGPVSGDFLLQGTWRAADLAPNQLRGVNDFDDAALAIASGATYFNVHSQVNPGGEIRGQICPTGEAANGFTRIATCKFEP